jgi:hypothetical protein
MTIFAVLLPAPQPSFAARIEERYAGSYFKVSDTQYLVSARSTAMEVSAKLGLDLADALAGSAIILAVSSYWGRAPTTVWDWIKTRMEAP